MKLALAATVALVDQQVESLAGSLEVLAQTEEARSGGWRALQPLLAVVQAGPVPCLCWFARPDGHYYTVSGGVQAATLADRPYFAHLLAGERVTCALVVSKSTGKKSAVVAVPIMRDGTMIGALGATIFLEELSQGLKEKLRLPDDMVYFALDDQGVAALHAQPERTFVEPAQAGSPTLAQAVREMLAHPEGVVHYEFEGTHRDCYYQLSRVTGWHFAMGTITR
jgi:hypothetical protein